MGSGGISQENFEKLPSWCKSPPYSFLSGSNFDYNSKAHFRWLTTLSTPHGPHSHGAGGVVGANPQKVYIVCFKYRSDNWNSRNSIISYQCIIFWLSRHGSEGGHVTPMTLPWICPVPISYSSMSREVVSIKGMPVQTNQWHSMDSRALINVWQATETSLRKSRPVNFC